LKGGNPGVVNRPNNLRPGMWIFLTVWPVIHGIWAYPKNGRSPFTATGYCYCLPHPPGCHKYKLCTEVSHTSGAEVRFFAAWTPYFFFKY
jgi:hypothetical protein